MAWQTHRSVPATSAAEAAHAILLTFIAAGWTCTGSGDGLSLVSAGNILTKGDTVGAGSLLNVRAWFKLRKPGGTDELCVQHISGGTTYRIKRARLGMALGTPTSTLVPNGATERVLFGAGTDASPTGASWFSFSPGAYRFWMRAENVAPYRAWSSMFPVGGGAPTHALAFDPITPPEPDGDPAVWYVAGSNAWVTSTMGSTSTNSQIFGDVPAASPTIGTTWLAVLRQAGGTALVPSTAAPTLSGADALYPIELERNSSIANSGRKGVSSLMAWVGQVRSTGTYHDLPAGPDGGPAARVVMGVVSLPNDGTEAPI